MGTVHIIAEHGDGGWVLRVSTFKSDGSGEYWEAHKAYDTDRAGRIIAGHLELHAVGKSVFEMLEEVESASEVVT